MRFHRLRVEDFAGIAEADIEFGPGLNVLYGPNDLGKSTLADAIRLVLLLPHTSTHSEPYAPWGGLRTPSVELTFETEPQRLWRVRKQFGKSGSSVLQESRNGRDFDEVERARKVDARLREILGWGVPEPGAGAGKGLPSSFLSTVLLSTQDDVTALLSDNLSSDGAASGKERIATALQAAAQDPLFLTLLHEAQARRDEAFTDKGARKTAKGSVFKVAADQLREARERKESLEKQVLDSEEVERELNVLLRARKAAESELAVAMQHLEAAQLVANQTAARETALTQLRALQAEMARIEGLGTQLDAAKRRATELDAQSQARATELLQAEAALAEAERSRVDLENATRASDSEMASALQQQQLERRTAEAERTLAELGPRLEAIAAADTLAQRVEQQARQLEQQQRETETLAAKEGVAAELVRQAREALERCELLDKALEVRQAEQELVSARSSAEEERALALAIHEAGDTLRGLEAKRSALVVPKAPALAPMRKLAAELAAARGALDVGLVVTVSPRAPLALRAVRDSLTEPPATIAQPMVFEASTSLDLVLGDLATVSVRGGRREAQEKVERLEQRWQGEVVPHLQAAAVADLEALDARILEARELDEHIRTKQRELETQRGRMALLSGTAERMTAAHARAEAARATLAQPIEPLARELDALGADATANLKKKRVAATRQLDKALEEANHTHNAVALARERTSQRSAELEATRAQLALALAAFPDGLAPARELALAEQARALSARQEVSVALAALKSAREGHQKQLDERRAAAETAVRRERARCEAARDAQGKVTGDHQFALREVERISDLVAREDLASAKEKLRAAQAHLAALPNPARSAATPKSPEQLVSECQAKLSKIEADIQLTRGRLMQVGGAVAKERLREAIDAFEVAERREKEVEAEYDAWLLLFEQMKLADAAQASNLGQALVPQITQGFEALTRHPYRLQLSAQLATDGIVAGGDVRDPARISLGTREQLATLYRLALAQHLRSTLVLDDQLVQSDEARLEWFRSLLVDKARHFQIVVFTCRPHDYLSADGLVSNGRVALDSQDGSIRAINLERAIRRRA
jgi:hypothetical protein